MATELMEKGAGASSTEDYVADPDAEPGADGKYALHWATIRKDANLVEKLLKQANVQKRDELQEESPLFLAVREWKPDDQIFNLLFQKAKKMNVLPQMQRKVRFLYMLVTDCIVSMYYTIYGMDFLLNYS